MAQQSEKKFQVKRAGVGGNRRNPNLRHIRHSSQSKPTFVMEEPDNSFGRNGDIVFWENPNNYNKIEQFIKHNNRWTNITRGRPSSDSATVKKFILARTDSTT